jgi:hypothetical protein
MPIDFVCPTCGKELPREARNIAPHTEEHIGDGHKEDSSELGRVRWHL